MTWDQIRDMAYDGRADDDVVQELWTADRDFSRFPTLTTRNPLVTS